MTETQTLHVLDLLDQADIEQPGPDHVGLQNMGIHRDVRPALFQHPDSAVHFPVVRLGRAPRLAFACGIKSSAHDRITTPVVFEIRVSSRTPDGAGPTDTVVFETRLDPRRNEADRSWRDDELDLGDHAGQTVRITFRTRVTKGDPSYAWAGWGSPRILHEQAPSPPRTLVKPSRPHVFLITADACTASSLGGYGNPEVTTPSLDRLAADAVLVNHARTQSTITPAAYASLLTALHPATHRTSTEWGSCPASFPTLPVSLAGHGYHTTLATSERELSDPRQGFSRLFHEVLPCLGNPFQIGEITTRRVLRWLRERTPIPTFLWLQYFDVHPPNLPAREFANQYYDGDPAAPENEFEPEKVLAVRGMESVLHFEFIAAAYRDGIPDEESIHRFRDTARTLLGELEMGPDLATQLLASGPQSRLGLSPRDFGRWLLTQVEELEKQRVPKELVDWLRQVEPQLRFLESDIISWLKGVRDFRYPLAMYKGAVSYFDHQLGVFLQALKDHGIYDDSLILFTAPHGEVLDQSDIHFHHHVLLESVLRIPLIIKPPRRCEFTPGSRIDGVFDLIDLFPTIQEGLGHTSPPGLEGVSRWSSISTGRSIPHHDSFAVDSALAAVSLCSAPYRLNKALKPLSLSPKLTLHPGQRALVHVEEDPDDAGHDRSPEMPQVAEELEARLDLWLTSHGLTPPESRG